MGKPLMSFSGKVIVIVDKRSTRAEIAPASWRCHYDENLINQAAALRVPVHAAELFDEQRRAARSICCAMRLRCNHRETDDR